MKSFFFFSHNKNKTKEIIKYFEDANINILSLKDFPIISEPKETGSSFNENAKIKSECGYKKTNLPCFADDSGICIDALNNLPGINSKKYLEECGSKEEAFKKIINETKKFSNNKAYFKTAISLTINKNESIFFNGVINGKISSQPRGRYGFAYDSIFVPSGHQKTFAEMSLKEKNKISHRSIALQKLKKYIINLFN